MQLTHRLGRLFWKLFAALWIATIVAFGSAFAYLRAMGLAPPPHPPAEIRLVQAVPVVSAAGASLLFSGLIAWYLSRPLRHLRWGLRRAAVEKFETRLQPLMGNRRDEIVDLAGEFDRMAASLQQLTRARQTLLHDLSHELRSPLSRMQVAVGLGRQNPEDAARMADRIEREIEHMDALVEELLTLHRLESVDAMNDANQGTATKANIDLVEILAAITDDAAFESSALGGNVILKSDGPFIARVCGELVYRAFENVIRNAVKYSPAGTIVEVHATSRQSGAMLRVEVRDRGPGVPLSQIEAIFEPFVRLGDAGVRGTGLGLAIARRSVLSQGGQIQALLRDGGGLIIRIEIPKTTP